MRFGLIIICFLSGAYMFYHAIMYDKLREKERNEKQKG